MITKLVKLLVFAVFAVMALGQMGVQITPLLAGIGVAGVGLSLAMQSVLGNLVAGLNIIFSKPFTVGEYIELLGVYGQVQDISLFSTILLHADNSRVVVPNRKIVGEILHNYGTMRQMSLSVGVAYDADITIATVKAILDRNPRVLKDPAPVCRRFQSRRLLGRHLELLGDLVRARLATESLDELPQLFNVLRGDMNVVGPRPEQPRIFQQLRSEIAQYQHRQRVLPGITGWAQINHHYDASVDDVKRKVAYDLEYIARCSAIEDLMIMLRTFPVIAFKKGAW